MDTNTIAGRLETFTVTGYAPSVLMADQYSWKALESVLGGDPVTAWTLKVMQHQYSPDDGSPRVQYQAEFLREQADEG